MDNASVKLSIVVPFYNEFHYISQAVNSCKQIHSFPYEIIIINDNPGNPTDQLLEEIPLTGPIRIVHQPENRGLQAARNTGIREALGEYIIFLDSDDYFMPETLEDLLRFVETHKCDLTHFNTFNGRSTERKVKTFTGDNLYFNTERILRGDEIPAAGMRSLSTWSCVYKAEFMRRKNLYGDEEQRKYEDRLYVMQSMLAAQSLAIYPHSIRMWRRRPNSITTSSNTLHDLSLKTRSFERLMSVVLDSGRSQDVQRTLIADNISLLFCQIISGGTDRAYQDLYIHERSEEIIPLRRAIGQSLNKVRGEDIDRLAFVLSEERLKRRTDYPRDFGFSLFSSVLDAICEEKPDSVRELIASKFPNAVESRPTLISETPASSAMTTAAPEGIDYYIHVGTHKTGTTSAQKSLDANRSLLAEHGLLFPKSGFGGMATFKSVKTGGLPGHDRLWQNLKQGDTHFLSEFREEIHSSGCRRVLISCENMASTIYGVKSTDRLEPLQNLIKLLPKLRSVQFVVYFRNPVTWLDSYYRELLSAGFHRALSKNGPDEFAADFSSFVDYATITKALSIISGRDVIVGDFESAKHRGFELDLLEKVIPEKLSDLSHKLETLEGTTYPAICDAQVEALQFIKTFVQEPQIYKKIAREFLERTMPTKQKQILFGPLPQKHIANTFLKTSGDFARERNLNALLDSVEKFQYSDTFRKTDMPHYYASELRNIIPFHRVFDGRTKLDDEFSNYLEILRLANKSKAMKRIASVIQIYYKVREFELKSILKPKSGPSKLS